MKRRLLSVAAAFLCGVAAIPSVWSASTDDLSPKQVREMLSALQKAAHGDFAEANKVTDDYGYKDDVWILGLSSRYTKLGRDADGIKFCERVLAMRKKKMGNTVAAQESPLQAMALIHLNKDKYAEADAVYQRLLPLYRQAYGSTLKTAVLLQSMGHVQIHTGKLKDAEKLLKESEEILEKQKVSKQDLSKWDSCLAGLGEIYRKQGRHAESEKMYQKAIAMHKSANRTSGDLYATVLDGYQRLLRDQKRNTEAEQLKVQAAVSRVAEEQASKPGK